MTRSAIEWNMASEAIGSFIGMTLKAYAKLSDQLHAAAIMAFVHAADHGDPTHLNAFNSGLRENDQNMLKAWLFKFSSYTNTVSGEEVKKQWIGYRTKEGKKGEAVGFFVKPNTQAIRKDKFSTPDMYEGEAFFDTADKPGKPVTLEAILAMLAKMKDQVEKREEKIESEVETHIPSDLMELVTTLSAKAELYRAAAKATATLNIQPATTIVQ